MPMNSGRRLAAIFGGAALLLSTPPAFAERKPGPLYISAISPGAPAVVPGATPQNSAKIQNQVGYKQYQKGLAAKAKGDLNQALIDFLQASKENPRLTQAFFEQALIFRQKGFANLAESALNQALLLEPNFQQARLLLAAVRLESGNVGGATRELGKSLGLELKSGNTVTTPGNRARGQVLEFKPEEGSATTKVPQPASAVADGRKPSPDPWLDRLRYLNEHGTSSLKPGEAFMFSEESGEALLILGDGKKIRRLIATPRNSQDLVQERRPELLLPKEFLYKLSTQGKVLSETESPAAERAKAVSDESSRSQSQASNWRNNGDENALEQDLADNPFTRTAVLDEPAKASPARKLPQAAREDSIDSLSSEGGSRLSLDQAEKLPEDNFDAGNLLPDLGLDAVVEKTQKFFGWLRKTLKFQ
ncbi:MAG TPA: hypothetical protein PKE54_18870 [Candidatus Obscuribacter sp.]|nr:hypothetical protein [Candidatus Obscuribacter sp.]